MQIYKLGGYVNKISSTNFRSIYLFSSVWINCFLFYPSGYNLFLRKWQPTQVFLPGKSHGQRSLVGYSPWGHKESVTIWQLNKNSNHYLFWYLNCFRFGYWKLIQFGFSYLFNVFPPFMWTSLTATVRYYRLIISVSVFSTVALESGEGNGNTLQYSCLGNPMVEELGRLQSMDRKESDTTERLHFHFSLSCTGEGNGEPLQYSCLENPGDRGAWWGAVYGVAQSRTRLTRLSSRSSRLGISQFTKRPCVRASMLSHFSCDPMDISRQAPLSMGFSRQEHEWVVMPSSRGSSWHRDWTRISYVSCIGSQVLYH